MTFKRPARADDPDSPQAAYLLGLRWLASRELSEGQVRERLERRGFSAPAVAAAIARLTQARALDDRRAALAAARTDVTIRHHGPLRILRRLQEMGIDGDLARHTVGELFDEIDQADLMRRALARRQREGAGASPDAAELRRLYAYLVRQGFAPSAVASLLRSRRGRGRAPADD